ncbi:3024_t:CDS:2, partial [Funneliformis caledonium]
LNIIIPNIEPPLIIPQEGQNNTIEMKIPLIQEDEEFNDNLAEWLKILEEIEEEKLEFLDIDIEDIEHLAQNHNAKWNLDIIFKNDLHCPF